VKEGEMSGMCSTNGENTNAQRLLAEKLEEKAPLGRPSRRLVDNIKMDLRNIGWDDVDWIDMAQDRGEWKALVNLRVP
jgi:hypothetical protein